MEPLLITAHLAAGIAQASPWGIALDGILASELWARHKDLARADGRPYTRAMEHSDPPDLDLPLLRCVPSTGPWHWAATCALPDVTDRVDVHSWTGRVDAAPWSRSRRCSRRRSPRQGRYRARRMPLLVTPCTKVTWRAVGDLAGVRDLLEPVLTIGKKRSSGEGQVLWWEIVPAPHLDKFEAAHLHQDGTLGRPCPPLCRALFGDIVDGGRGWAGVRPPYMHPSRAHDLALPALLE